MMNRTASGIGMYQSIYGVFNRISRNADDSKDRLRLFFLMVIVGI